MNVATLTYLRIILNLRKIKSNNMVEWQYVFVSSDKEINQHKWSSDALLQLSDIVNEQLRALDRLNFSHIYTKCQQELESWHPVTVAYLGQIYSQRLEDLAEVYTQDVCRESEKI